MVAGTGLGRCQDAAIGNGLLPGSRFFGCFSQAPASHTSMSQSLLFFLIILYPSEWSLYFTILKTKQKQKWEVGKQGWRGHREPKNAKNPTRRRRPTNCPVNLSPLVPTHPSHTGPPPGEKLLPCMLLPPRQDVKSDQRAWQGQANSWRDHHLAPTPSRSGGAKSPLTRVFPPPHPQR